VSGECIGFLLLLLLHKTLRISMAAFEFLPRTFVHFVSCGESFSLLIELE